jgi:dinuclear metal center YbgI/SA1388 family protein
MKTREVIEWLDATFKPEYQEDYDNSGFLLGDARSDYRGALVALDLTPAVVDEAVRTGASLIVTHHPFIFTGVKRLTDGSATGRMVMTLAKNDIAVYAAHTNLDNLPWGVNGILAQKLGLQNCHILQPSSFKSNPSTEIGAGMVGELPREMETDKFLLNVKNLINQPSIRTSKHNPNRMVKRVALCGGAGSFLISDAIASGADIFLTADLKYHDFQRGEGRIILADAGHYETEQFAKEIISRTISEKFRNFAACISERQHAIVQYI